MKAKDMKIGKPVDIFITREGFKYKLGSKIEEVGNNIAYISLITSKGRVFQFDEKDDVTVVYRADARMYEWNKVHGGIERLDGEFMHTLSMTGEGKPYNRREAFRVPVDETAVFSRFEKKEHVSQEEINEAKEKMKIKKTEALKDNMDANPDFFLLPEEDPRYKKADFAGWIKDISKSGVGLYTNERLDIDSNVMFELFTPYGKMFKSSYLL